MLSRKRIQTIEHNLEEERARLLRRLGDPEAGSTTRRSGNRTGADIAGQDRSMAVQTVQRDVLEQIESALERIEEGSYGTCERCGKPINPERLDALPYATLCIACQSVSNT